MALLQQIEEDLVAAIKSQDETKIQTLRMLKATIHNFQIAAKKETFSDQEILPLIQKEIKSRQESMALYQQGNRPELAAKEEKEIEVLQKYLPEQISDDALRSIVQETIQKTQVKGMEAIGRVIGQVMPQVSGRADGARVAKIVREELSRN